MTARVITVFGGSGFIGRYLVKRLAKTGAVLRIGVRDPGVAKFLKPLGDVGQIYPFKADLGDDAAVAAAVAGADAVVNLVGILYEKRRGDFTRIHVDAAARIARAAKAAGVARLVHMSALGADAKSDSDYARTKAEGEAAVRAAFPDATIFRPSVVFGPEDAFFNRFAGMTRFLPAIPMIGGGATQFQPVYVGDVADALFRGVEDPATVGKTYELGGPRVYSFEQILDLILSETGRHRGKMEVPFFIANLQATFLELLPVPPLTRDQVKLLQRDNVVSGSVPGLRELGIEPTAAEIILPTYLDRFRKGGRFGTAHGI